MIYEVNNLKFSYNKKTKLLDNINLEINEGELLCVLGKNGSGKSTLFNCLLGILKKDGGNVLLEGNKIENLKEKDIAKFVGYVAQSNNSTFNFTVYEYVLMGCAKNIGLFSRPTKKDKEEVYEILKRLNIEHLIYRKFNELSGGEKQQVAIARAMMNKPKIIIFDEPTAHLDYHNQIKVLKMIKKLSQEGYAILISTHDPNHALLLDGKVALLDNNGHLIVGNTKELITENNLSSIYGNEIKVRYIDEFNRNVCIYPSL